VHGGHIPKLWPFFRHTLSAVRLAVLQTLRLLLGAESAAGWLHGALESMMRLALQNLLLEENAEIRNLTSDLCVSLTACCLSVSVAVGGWVGGGATVVARRLGLCYVLPTAC
jgi:hypothetical protein